ncbi:MAG TPA: phospho-sugar mutase [Gemmataceae bacterium]|nr:phospho-sugar mutase [Gemmataceae bacterium]
MTLLEQAIAGIGTVQVDAVTRDQASKHLSQWLIDPAFGSFLPQLEWLIQQKQWAGLVDRFYQILPFGTGGRRGPVGIGPNRMNLWTLGASVQGHSEYLKQKFPGKSPHVVLAYDVRCFEDNRKNYNPALPNPVLHLSSRDMAQHAASIYAANGIAAWILPPDSQRYLATPELSFAIRHLKAHGGLNISASHNPPDDNGGKFYDERGGQPVAPDDQIMADLVEQVGAIKSLPWNDAHRSGKIHYLNDDVHKAYIDLILKLSLLPAPKYEDMQIVFTPLHGVGAMTAMEALVHRGFRVTPVQEQMKPDGQFTNVTKSPNPEVPESMDRAAALAKKCNADLVLSTDPDADRLGAMAPDRKGNWRTVTGNEIAALLTHFKLAKLSQQGHLPRSAFVIRTEVTISQITRIARHFNAQIVDNLLVGFKYVADVLRHIEDSGSFEEVRGTMGDFVIATEESHGALVTPDMRDKDSASAALLMAELMLDLRRSGRLLEDYQADLAKQFGYFRNDGVPVYMGGILGKQNMVRMIDALRSMPLREIGGLAVTRFEDLRDPKGRFGPLKGATDAAARNFVIFYLGDRAKVVLRPSGTEPKAKVYLEVCTPPCPAGTSSAKWEQQCREVDTQLKTITEDFLTKALGLIGMTPADAGMK